MPRTPHLARRLCRHLRAAALAALLFAPHLAGAQSCTSPIAAADLITPGKLQMAINPTLPPAQFVDAAGDLQGLNVELARDMARRLCLQMEFVRMDFPAMFPALAAARFDGIDTGMFWTEERSRIAYTVPYAQQAISVVVPVKSTAPIKSAEDLPGHSVGVEVNSYQERWLKKFDGEQQAKGGKPIEIRAFTTLTDVLAAMRAGQVEAVALIDVNAREYTTRGFVRIVDDGLGGSPTTLVFRQRSVAAAAANALTAMRADGTYDRLFDKFGLTRATEKVFAIRGPGPK